MFKRFHESVEGSILPVAAVGLLAIVASAGAAFDYSTATAARNSARNVADSMVLAVANELSAGSSRRDAVKAGEKFFEGNYSHISLSDQKIKHKIIIKKEGDDYDIAAQISGKVTTGIMGVFGFDKLPYQVESTSKVSLNSVEVAFVADVSWSMLLRNRMPKMQEALTQFTDSLFLEGKSNSKRRITLVPFADSVNLGPGYQKWLSKDPSVAFKRDYVGCFRNESDDQIQTDPEKTIRPGGFSAYKQRFSYGLPHCPSHRSRIRFFENRPGQLKQDIRNLEAGYATSTDIGLLWGWRALSPSWRGKFNESKQYPKNFSSENKKYLIILTDGAARRVVATGDGRTMRAKDGRRVALQNFIGLCDSIKANGRVDVFAISYSFDAYKEDEMRVAMKNCATSGGGFYEATTESISDVLKTISTKINTVRLTS